MKKLIMLLMILTLAFTACGKKEEKDEMFVNPIETSKAPSYEEETEVETEKEIETETEPEEIILEEGQFLVTGPDDEIGKPTMIWDEKDYVFNEELALEIIDSLNEYARDVLGDIVDPFVKDDNLTNMAKIRATELYDVVYKSGETVIKQIKDLSPEEKEKFTSDWPASELDENEYVRVSRVTRLNGDENAIESLILESKNRDRFNLMSQKFGFYELGTPVDDILFAENGFRVLHEDGLMRYDGYVSNVAHFILGSSYNNIGIACYENTNENTLVVSIIIAPLIY